MDFNQNAFLDFLLKFDFEKKKEEKKKASSEYHCFFTWWVLITYEINFNSSRYTDLIL